MKLSPLTSITHSCQSITNATLFGLASLILAYCTGCGTTQQTTTGESYLIRAREARKVGDYTGAYDLCQRAIERAKQERDPSQLPHALLEMGNLCKSGGRFSQADTWYRQALTHYAELEKKFYSSGETIRQSSGKASRELMATEHMKCLDQLAGTLWQECDFAQAEKSYEQAMNLVRKLHLRGRQVLQLARHYQQFLNYQHNERYANELEIDVAATNFELPDLLQELADAAECMRRERNQAAIVKLQAAARVAEQLHLEEDKVMNINVQLGLCHLRVGEFEQAKHCLAQALRFHSPGTQILNSEALALMACCLQLEGNENRASEMMQAAVSINREHVVQLICALITSLMALDGPVDPGSIYFFLTKFVPAHHSEYICLTQCDGKIFERFLVKQQFNRAQSLLKKEDCENRADRKRSKVPTNIEIVSRSLNNVRMAQLYLKMGKLAQAEECLKQNLAQLVAVVGSISNEAAAARTYLVQWVYVPQKRFKEAEVLITPFLHTAAPTDHMNTAFFLAAVGRTAEAEGYYREAMLLYESQNAVDATTLPGWRLIANLLAALYTKSNNQELAEHLLYNALLQVKTHMPDSPEEAAASADLAATLAGHKNYSEAVRYYKNALAFYERTNSIDALEAQQWRWNLWSSVYSPQYDLLNGVLLYEDAVAFCQEQQVAPEVVANYTRILGDIYQCSNNYTRAAACYQQATAIYKHVKKKDYHDWLSLQCKLANVHLTDGSTGSVDAELKPLLQELRKLDKTKKDNQLASIIEQLGLQLYRQKVYSQENCEIFEIALQLLEDTTQTLPERIQYRSYLAASYEQVQNSKRAEQELDWCLRALESNPQPASRSFCLYHLAVARLLSGDKVRYGRLVKQAAEINDRSHLIGNDMECVRDCASTLRNAQHEEQARQLEQTALLRNIARLQETPSDIRIVNLGRQLADIYIANNNFSGAEKLLKQAISRCKTKLNDAWTLIWSKCGLVNIYMLEKKEHDANLLCDEVLSDLKKNSSIEAWQSAAALNHLAGSYICSNRPEEAFALCQQALKYLAPTDRLTALLSNCYLLMGQAREGQNKAEDAKGYYRHVLSINQGLRTSQKIDALFRLGFLSMREKRFDEASRTLEEALKLAIELQPYHDWHKQLLVYLSCCNVHLQNFPRAIQQATESLQFTHSRYDLELIGYTQLAVSAAVDDNWKSAQNRLTKAYKLAQLDAKLLSVYNSYFAEAMQCLNEAHQRTRAARFKALGELIEHDTRLKAVSHDRPTD